MYKNKQKTNQNRTKDKLTVFTLLVVDASNGSNQAES
jgi:hypothetical protein